MTSDSRPDFTDRVKVAVTQGAGLRPVTLLEVHQQRPFSTVADVASAEETTTFELYSTSPPETTLVGEIVARWLMPGDVVVLSGDLGAGKTCLAKGIGSGLGIEQPITSPTFALANRYRIPGSDEMMFHHLDAYRIQSPGHADDLDLGELMESGITVVEWGEQIADAFGVDPIVVTLRYPEAESSEPLDLENDTARSISFSIPTRIGSGRIGELKSRLGVDDG